MFITAYTCNRNILLSDRISILSKNSTNSVDNPLEVRCPARELKVVQHLEMNIASLALGNISSCSRDHMLLSS